MLTRYDLPALVVEALKANNGSASLLEVCKYVWHMHKDKLENSNSLFYTWQYEIRWAATELRKTNIMKPAEVSPKGIWELA